LFLYITEVSKAQRYFCGVVWCGVAVRCGGVGGCVGGVVVVVVYKSQKKVGIKKWLELNPPIDFKDHFP
tara:strand:+ start:71 stop:277 length:207 start_codon:yes stop_codon:yes gene_type:complete